MERRPLGNTGDYLSILGFGGVIVTDTEQTDADHYVAEAIDQGVNYFDVSPNYGNAQDRLGPALEGKRQNVFLACKTEKRTKQESQAELENSLRVLRTDHFDLYQFHAVKTIEQVEMILGPDGAMETFVKAQKEGKIRHIGFSVHTEEAALALLEQFAFTSVLFPVNWVSLLSDKFGNKIMQKAMEKGAARLAIKAMAKNEWPAETERKDRKYPKCWYEPIDDESTADLALRYAISQPITAAIPPGDIRLFRMAAKIANDYKPISDQELDMLKAYAKEVIPVFPKAY